MYKAYRSIFFFWVSITVFSCKSSEIASNGSDTQELADTVTSTGSTDDLSDPVYLLDQRERRGSGLRTFDLLHTRLELEPNWSKSQLNGKATLKLTPYFYPQSSIEIDAEGFDLNSVKLKKVDKSELLTFDYDSTKIFIDLDREYERGDVITIEIDYVAKPEELTVIYGDAIKSDKGLFFIDPLDTIPSKPTQLWTQGQAQAAARWFPTLNTPNERCTQELYIKVDTVYETLSNGILESSLTDDEGKRTDYWKLSKPHAPYLFTIVVGDFAVVKDKSGKIPLTYYVEPEYSEYAKSIFGNTSDMLTHFEEILGVKYPWKKYAQVVVRDYVSGAMENTTASTFMEQLQMNDRELIDAEWDDIIAHELFHQWFGDYVTCESWSYLTLNEAFATYSEFLWREKADGISSAQLWRMGQLQQYFAEAEEKRVPIIRYQYEDEDALFDSHTYAKGGLVLHMLRSYVGDEVFFKSLQKYLQDNALSSVELADLRQSFEEVSGEDLNWFFDQWFLAPGHPVLEVEHNYDTGILTISIEQVQDKSIYPLYRLPIYIDIWTGEEQIRYPVQIENELEEFEIALDVQPDLVVIDGDYQLTGEVYHPKTDLELKHQYIHSGSIQAKHEALDVLSEYPTDSISKIVLEDALDDDFWSIREQAVLAFDGYPGELDKSISNKIFTLLDDKKSDVRAAAVEVLASNNPSKETIEAIGKKISDSSYYVASTALGAYLREKGDNADQLLLDYEKTENPDFILAISEYYSTNRVENKHEWFYNKIEELEGLYLWSLLLNFNELNLFASEEKQKESISVLKDIALNHEAHYVRLVAFQGLIPLDIFEGVNDTINQIKRQETDLELIDIYDSMY
ncbi:MAG: M1 family metallopeptidase [Bacteroidota bacterium]